MEQVRELIERNTGDDPVEVFLRLRKELDAPMHGPLHHVMAPLAFLMAYRAKWGEPSVEAIEKAVSEASELKGGICASWGACGAAVGMGIAYAAILGATPLRGEPRGRAQAVVAATMRRLAELRAARCCRRDSLVALEVACELSSELLPHPLATFFREECDQVYANRECIGQDCSWHKA